MDRTSAVVEILKTEYGITTMADLNKAIANLGVIDLSPFCTEPKKRRRIDNDE